jgi:2-dehydro-3-deoxyphosphogalactonate aldolase
VETILDGAAATPFLMAGDRVRISMEDAEGHSIFGAIELEVVAAAGGTFIVSPDTNAAVIKETVSLTMRSYPGVFTPTEAFAAIRAGARRIKLFPAGALGPSYLKALLDVLPKDVGAWAVGGVDAGNARDWLAAGAEGVAVGGSVYKPGDTAQVVSAKAQRLVAALAG